MRSGVSVQGPQGGTALSGPEDSCRGETRQVRQNKHSLSCVYSTMTIILPKEKTAKYTN